MYTRKQLAITLSKLKDFENPDPAKEQYITDSEVASQIIWNAYMLGDIKDKIIADLGSGTGMLGLGAILLNAKWLFMVEIDKKAEDIAKRNLESLREIFEIGNNTTFLNTDISSFNKEVEVVIQNPPFGVQTEHADRPFLLKAFQVGKVVYSIHKIESEAFIKKLASENNFKVTHLFRYNLAIKKTMEFHTHRIERVAVGCFRLQKN
jgi:putative methylase